MSQLILHPRFIAIALGIFVAIRLGLILFVPVSPYSDALWYFNSAVRLADGGSYREGDVLTAFWPVGYPGFLAGLFYWIGPSVRAAQFANLLFAIASFFLVLTVARRVHGNETAARVAALLIALYPNNAAYVPLLLTETAYTFILLLAVVLVLRPPSWRNTLSSGVLLGAATLVKTQTLAMVPLLVLLASSDTWRWRSLMKSLPRALIVTLIAFMTVLPWSYRNYQVFGQFVFVSTNGGLSLLAGNNPSVVGDYRQDFNDTDPLFKAGAFSVADQLAADQRMRALAKQWILDNPVDFLRLIPKKVFRLWAVDGEAEWNYQATTPFYEQVKTIFRATRLVNQGIYLAILGLAVVGLVMIWRLRSAPPAYIGVGLAAMTTGICVIVSGQSRYHYPVMPFFIIYAALALSVLIDRRARE